MKTITSSKSIISALGHFKNAIESHDVNQVVELYHPDAVFWGAFSTTICPNKKLITDYYNRFFSFKNLKLDITDVQVRVYENIAVISGSYDFNYEFNNHNKVVDARFSLVYKLEQNEWLIIDHHSSIMPKESYS